MLLSVLLLLSGLACIFGKDDHPASFYLTNPKKPSQRTKLVDDFSSINVNYETIILAHGWLSQPLLIYYYYDVPREFHAKGDYNVILVDWTKVSTAFYRFAAAKIGVVGDYIGDFLLRLAKEIGLDLSRVHLVANSLGAHMMGCAGRRVAINGHQVGRITGLDPCKLDIGLGIHETNKQLRKTDATTVVVLHTDGEGMGMTEAIGTVDFYANCGISVQPPCRFNTIFDYINLSKYDCSHKICMRYFIESINSKLFIGKRCSKSCGQPSCNESIAEQFGPDTPASARGSYYFSTNPKSPYAMGNNDLS